MRKAIWMGYPIQIQSSSVEELKKLNTKSSRIKM